MQIKRHRRGWLSKLSSRLKLAGRKSLQLRLTAGITTIALLSIGIIGSWTTWKMRNMLVVDHQQEMQQIATHLNRQLATAPPAQWQQVIAEWAAPNLWVGVMPPQGELNGKLLQAGRPLMAANRSLTGEAVASEMAAISWATVPTQPTVQQIEGRQLVLNRHLLQSGEPPAGELYLARDITHDYQVLSTLVNQLLFGTALALLPIVALVAMYIRQALSPLRRMNQLAMTQLPGTAPVSTGRSELPRSELPRELYHEVPREVSGLVQVMSSLSNQLSETGHRQRDFTNSLSHELRTSLCLVQGYLKSTLRRGLNLTSAQREALEIADSEVDRTVELLQDLLDLGRSCVDGASCCLKPIALNDLIEGAVRAADPQHLRSVELEAETLVVAQAEISALHRVLVHLLKNAIQFSPPDQPIRIRLTQADQIAVIQVTDYGCGIAVADQAHLFEPFYRVEQSRCRATGGVGLGLAIVKSLVEAMRGSVSVVSQPGVGSQFTVRLQAAQAAAQVNSISSGQCYERHHSAG